MKIVYVMSICNINININKKEYKKDISNIKNNHILLKKNFDFN